MNRLRRFSAPDPRTLVALALALLASCGTDASVAAADEVRLTDEQVDELVRLSYPYVAMFNVNNKFALKQGGWNTVEADTQLKDHTMREIARPNNDTLYVACMLDLRAEPMVLDLPAFDSEYVSLMITAYDHYVNIPMSTGQGDFADPARVLVHSARTEGYDGEAVEGVDRTLEATGDFVSAVLRVMPHANEPERFERIVAQMQSVRALPLSAFLGGAAPPAEDPGAPSVGKSDFDVYENNLAEVMQYVFNHTTFDSQDPIDQAVLAAWAPLGVAPGKEWSAGSVAQLDGERLRAVAEALARRDLGRADDPQWKLVAMTGMFLPKGQMTQELLVFQSIIGPIGMPASEAVYPAIPTADGRPMNAMHDYVVRMAADELPPAGAFWSFTLYDLENGFFIPNERKKYSVGKNGGMQLDEDGGIEVHVAAERPEGVPEENWLPIERRDEDLGLILRLYVPDLEALETWKEPVAERR